MNTLSHFSSRILASVVLSFLPVSSCLAGAGDRSLVSYFVDNIVVEIVVSGGYYSIFIALVLTGMAIINKKFREILFSFLLAVFGILLLIFVYEAFLDFQWLPATY